MTLDQASQALRDNPTVGGCIDFLNFFGMPAMIAPDKYALGSALKMFPRATIEEHLADALVDWMRVWNKREKVLSVPQAVRKYLGERVDGKPVEDTASRKPKALTEAQEAAAQHLFVRGWSEKQAHEDVTAIRRSRLMDKEEILSAVFQKAITSVSKGA